LPDGQNKLIWFGKFVYVRKRGRPLSQIGRRVRLECCNVDAPIRRKNTMPASAEAQITEWIASQQQAMIDLLRDAVNIDSEGEFAGGCADSGFTASVGTPTICGVGPVHFGTRNFLGEVRSDRGPLLGLKLTHIKN